MKLNSTPLIAVDLDATSFGRVDPLRGADPARWLELVLALERAGVGLITLADPVGARDGLARLDAVMRAAWLAARTTSVGLMAAVDTTVTEPFLLAVQIATADFISHGRAGWLCQVSGRPSDAGYVGPRQVATGGAAWDEAREYAQVVRALWDSWEDGAEIRDVPGQRFIDRERIHAVDFAGEHLSIRGPSITPRSPQGQPPIGLAVPNGGDHSVVALGLTQADVLFLGAGFDADGVRRAAAGQGRPVRLLADVALAEASVGRVGEVLSDGYHGVRLLPSTSADDLAAVIDLTGALGLGGGEAASGAAPVTLRGRLGLTRPANRFTPALAAGAKA